ncbi:hypothetical protein DPMN_135550 [Dreissena polymorpha]|uniref:Uncharacterized protein n=1 Tax=Dreissena polymorpha TaxID=45954 RepID=A0A9D4JD16_DREPO|nr:hypothetical protein DPMN_135550 [Dreissena polymorpha]
MYSPIANVNQLHNNFEGLLSELTKNLYELSSCCGEYVTSLGKQIESINVGVKSCNAQVTLEIYEDLNQYQTVFNDLQKIQNMLSIVTIHGNANEQTVVVLSSRKDLNICTKTIENQYISKQTPNINTCETALQLLASKVQFTSHCSDDVDGLSECFNGVMASCKDGSKELNRFLEESVTTSQLNESKKDTSKNDNNCYNRSTSDNNLTGGVQTVSMPFACYIVSIHSDTNEFTHARKMTNVNQTNNLHSPADVPKPGFSKNGKAKKCTNLMYRCLRKCQQSPIRTPTDNTCCSIVASMKLPGHRFAILDAGNRKVKVLSIDLKVLAELEISEQPADMCVCQKDKDKVFLCVCVPKRKVVKIIDITTNYNLNITRTVSTRFHPVSLTAFKSNIIILTQETMDTIEKLFESFNIFDDKITICKATALNRAIRIRIRSKKTLFVVRDNKVSCENMNDMSKCVSITGVRWYYKYNYSRAIKGASDVAFEDEGNVYVCETNSNNVHQVASDTYYINRIIVDDIERPTTVLVDQETNRIIVGCEKSNQLHVYMLSNRL